MWTWPSDKPANRYPFADLNTLTACLKFSNCFVTGSNYFQSCSDPSTHPITILSAVLHHTKRLTGTFTSTTYLGSGIIAFEAVSSINTFPAKSATA